MARKKIYKKVRLEGMYCLNGEYTTFTHNPYHGKEFENVPVTIKKEIRKFFGHDVEVDVISIGENVKLPDWDNFITIDCELVSKTLTKDGTLILRICQDWG